MALYEIYLPYAMYTVELSATLEQIETQMADNDLILIDPVDRTKRIIRTADIKMVAEAEEE